MADVVDHNDPRHHDSVTLAAALMELYEEASQKTPTPLAVGIGALLAATARRACRVFDLTSGRASRCRLPPPPGCGDPNRLPGSLVQGLAGLLHVLAEGGVL